MPAVPLAMVSNGSGSIFGTKAEYARTLATALVALTRCSQALQWARDQNTALCTDYLNNRMGLNDYIILRKHVMAESAKLINAELPHLAPLVLGSLPPPPKPDSSKAPKQGN